MELQGTLRHLTGDDHDHASFVSTTDVAGPLAFMQIHIVNNLLTIENMLIFVNERKSY